MQAKIKECKEECTRVKLELKKATCLRDQMLQHNQEARRRVSGTADLKLRLNFKKKEIKLTKQKLHSLEDELQRFEGAFSKIRAVLQNDL